MVAEIADPEVVEQRAFRAAEIVEKLRDLTSTPGWKVLEEIFEAQKAKYYADLSRSLMRGADIEQRKLDFNRGLFEGMEQLLKSPEDAEKVFERAMSRLKKARESESE